MDVIKVPSQQPMIPKIIHYIWFGGKAKPPLVLETLESWKRFLPDYEIIEWNEGNFDVTLHPWMEAMHREGKFAFASDWARLYVLKEHGGIYLDTDVELKKSLDPFLRHGMFWGFEYDCYLATCITGSRPGHPLLDELLKEYDETNDNLINNSIVTKFFLKRFPDFRLNNADQVIKGDVHLFGKEYFSVPTYDKAKGFSRHHGSNLWKGGGAQRSWLKGLLRRTLGEVLYYRLVSWKVCQVNEFRPVWEEHRKRKG
jgi:hypothetical protein